MQRNTIQRQVILNALIKLNTHPTVDEIYAEVNKEHTSISKTTVYRNLRQLAENNVIRHVFMPDGLERYDSRIEWHSHFKCKECDTIIDVDVEYPETIDEIVHQKYGFLVDEHNVIFSGICINCRDSRILL